MTDIWYRSPRISANIHNNSWQNFSFFPQVGNIVLQAPLSSTTSPTIGSAPTFARASTEYGSSVLTTISPFTSGNAVVPVFQFNGGVGAGYQVQGTRKNLITFSDDLSNAAWTAIGTTSVLNFGATGSPFTDTSNSTQMTASSTPGGRQFDSTILAASNKFCLSGFVTTVFGGNTTGKISLSGSASSEQVDQAWSTGTTTGAWTRFSVSKTFTAGATGNCFAKITIDNSGSTALITGLMLEQTNDSGVAGAELAKPSAYIRTSGATATSAADALAYSSSDVAPAMQKGSASIWVNTSWIQTDTTSTNRDKMLWNISNTDFNLALSHLGTPANLTFYYGTVGTVIHNVSDSWTANTWRNYIVTWDNSGAAINSQIYKNGSQVGTNTTATPTTPTAGSAVIGKRGTAFNEYYLNGLLRNFTVWKVQLSASEALAVFNAERGNFGV